MYIDIYPFARTRAGIRVTSGSARSATSSRGDNSRWGIHLSVCISGSRERDASSDDKYAPARCTAQIVAPCCLAFIRTKHSASTVPATL